MPTRNMSTPNTTTPAAEKPSTSKQPLMENYHAYLEDYAKTVLTDGGQPAMKRAAEHLSTR